jgi:hypothetical protein
MLRSNIRESLWLLECGAVKQWEMTSLLRTPVLPANWTFQNRKSGCFALIWQKKHDKWQNSHGALLQKQLQTALILSVIFI